MQQYRGNRGRCGGVDRREQICKCVGRRGEEGGESLGHSKKMLMERCADLLFGGLD